MLRFADLCAILHGNKSLRTFIYEYDGRSIFSSLNTPHLQTALDTMQRTLKILWLDYVDCLDVITESTANVIRAMNFTSFTSLQFLHLASVFIYDRSEKDQKRRLSNALPSQLLSLEITHSKGGSKFARTENLLNEIKDLLQEKSQLVKLVDLKRLVLESDVFHPFYILTFGKLLGAILATAESSGLEITLINSDTEDEDPYFDYDFQYEELRNSASRKMMWDAGVNRFNHVRAKEVVNTQELRERIRSL